MENTLLAFWIFAGSAVSHTIVNWKTGQRGPLFGDAQFMMVNFLACLAETMVFNILAMRRKCVPNGIKRAMGYIWVTGFFYVTAAPWQYAKAFCI
jgi:hypothetical protein